MKILTFGVFDYFHLGHLRLFKQTKSYADYLIVGVQDDKYVNMFKPDAKLLYTTDERVEILQALRDVNEVFVYDILLPEILERVDFDILALGEDHYGERFDALTTWCSEHNKKVVRLKRLQGISSTYLRRSKAENTASVPNSGGEEASNNLRGI